MNPEYLNRIQQYVEYLKDLIEQGQPVNMYPDEWFMRKSMYELFIKEIESGRFENAWDQIANEDFGQATELLIDLLRTTGK